MPIKALPREAPFSMEATLTTDPAGNFSLIPSYFAQPGTTIRTEQHNPVLEDIAAGLSARLMRDGRNGMVGNLEMGTFQIRNVGKSTLASGGARVDQTVPIGTVVDYAGTTQPAGWFFCAGQTLNRSDWPDLFAVIGTTYGAPTGLTFQLPDTRGRVVAGRDDMAGDAGRLSTFFGAVARTLGGALGAASHVLTIGQMPSHNHTGLTTNAGSHNHGGGTTDAGFHAHTGSTSTNGAHQHTVSSVVVNGGGASSLVGGGILGVGTAATSAAGDHVHSVFTDGAGTHNHGITTDTHAGHVHGIFAEGGGAAHGIAQPSLILNKLIKATY